MHYTGTHSAGNSPRNCRTSGWAADNADIAVDIAPQAADNARLAADIAPVGTGVVVDSTPSLTEISDNVGLPVGFDRSAGVFHNLISIWVISALYYFIAYCLNVVIVGFNVYLGLNL